MDGGQRAPALDRRVLAEPVRHALHSQSVEILDWHCHPLRGGTETPVGVYRVSGTARVAAGSRPWSLVLKIAAPVPAYAAPAHPYYWKREALAYQSGLLEDLPEALAAPRCCAVQEHAAGSPWLWLEDLTSADDARWTLSQYARAARCLGRFNGAYLVGRPLPSAPWLSVDWLRVGVESAAAAVASFPDVLAHPRVRRLYSDELVRRLLRLWAARERLLEALDRLPQTFCHLDAFRRNLFLRPDAAGRDHLVAIDWTFAGLGALGQELAAFVTGPLLFDELDLSVAQELEELALRHYVAGLAEVGWRGDPRVVQLGYSSAAPLLYVLHSLDWVLATLQDDRRYTVMPQGDDHADEAPGNPVPLILGRLFDLAEQAQTLAQSL